MTIRRGEVAERLQTAARATDTEQAVRRQAVRDMRTKGKSTKAIASHLAVSVKTVLRDLRHLRQHPPSQAEEDSLAEMVSSHFSEIEEKARSIFDDHSHSANSRIQALEVFRKTQGDRVRYAKDAGFLSKQPGQLEVTHRHASLDWSPEMRERVAHALVEATLTTHLAEPTPEEECIDVDYTESQVESV